MSFLSLGDGSIRPTFFELVAAERLMPSLKAAIVYSLSVFAQRRPELHRVLDYEDEAFALVNAVLNCHTLAGSSSSFAESLYGLKRSSTATESRRSSAAPDESSISREAKAPLSLHQRRTTLLLLVGLPYVKAKLDALYNRNRARGGLRGISFVRQPQVEQQPQQLAAATASVQQPLPVVARLRAVALRVFLRVYPWLHAAHEGVQFGYHLLYLLDSNPFYSPSLHFLRQTIIRVSGQELVEAEQRTRQRRWGQVAAARQAPTWLERVLRVGLLRCGHTIADHSRNSLILAVFGYKILEWWYTSGEDKLGSNKALPPPPPPKAPPRGPDGITLLEDASLCSLCSRERTNPAMAAVSGYVFCYPCLFSFVSQKHCCPVSQIPMGVEQIRRLYQSA